MATTSGCIASASDAARQLGELVRREWPACGGRRVDEAVRVHAARLLNEVAELDPPLHMLTLRGIIATLLHACVMREEQDLLARHGL